MNITGFQKKAGDPVLVHGLIGGALCGTIILAVILYFTSREQKTRVDFTSVEMQPLSTFPLRNSGLEKVKMAQKEISIVKCLQECLLSGLSSVVEKPPMDRPFCSVCNTVISRGNETRHYRSHVYRGGPKNDSP